MLPRDPAIGFGLVTLGAALFILNAGVSRVVLRAGVDPVTRAARTGRRGGAAVDIGDGAVFDPIGIAAGLGAAVRLSTYFIVGEHGVGTLDPLRVIIWSFLVGAVALNLVDPVTGFATSVLDQQVSPSARWSSTPHRCGSCWAGSSCRGRSRCSGSWRWSPASSSPRAHGAGTCRWSRRSRRERRQCGADVMTQAV